MNKLFDTHNSHSPAGLELLSQDGPSHALVVRSHTLHHGPHLPREVRSGQVPGSYLGDPHGRGPHGGVGPVEDQSGQDGLDDCHYTRVTVKMMEEILHTA